MNIALGAALLVTPFAYGVSDVQLVASIVCGLAPVAVAFARDAIHGRYAGRDQCIV